jgi:hypothetical protein
MRILEDWKCSLTTALLTVLVFLFLSQLLEVKGTIGQGFSEGEFFDNTELVLILSVFIGYLLNVTLFKECAPSRN